MACATAWSFEWFNMLTPAEQEGLRGTAEPARKRARNS